MAGMLELDRTVRGFENGLGDFRPGERKTRGGSQIPLLYQVLEPERFFVAFEPGGGAYQVLSNDQNRFSLPRSLPPILDLELPEDVDNPTGAYVVARYAYTEGAFRLLEDLLAEGHVFSMNGFLEFAWSMAKALAFLHEHGIVHGQWNAKSVIAVPTEELAHPLLEVSNNRFEVINTGVCFRNAAAIPEEYLERGYYPPEVFLSEGGGPDYGALDLVGDVFCFAAFLKDLMQRSCSSEELPSQARRILEELQKEANRRGWKAAPESLQRKEMEILDHLYTIRIRSETLIQEALLPREERCGAPRLLEVVEDLHAKGTSYLEQLFARGFEPVNAFGEGLQHYTTFQLEVSPKEINSYEDSRVVLTGRGLPHELVRVTLNETHQGVRVLSAQPGRIEFLVERGFRPGEYRVSVNNRRTNGRLEVYSSVWKSIEPGEVHQPWEGFGNIRVCVRGERLPVDAEFGLLSADGDRVPAIVVLPAEIEEGIDDGLQLTFPCDTAAGDYQVVANGRPTGLPVRVLEQLPDPVVGADGVVPDQVKNHRAWALRLAGRNLHPRMVVDFGEATPDGLRLSVISPTEAVLELPSRFPAGEYPLRVNYRETGAGLSVIEPRWTAMDPPAVKLARRREEPIQIRVGGESLPAPSDETPYSLRGRGAEEISGAVYAEETEPGSRHLLKVGPDLPRGRCSVSFGDLDTGLKLRVRRQLPRSAVAGLWLVGLTLLGGAGLALRQAFAPRIGGVSPESVYAFGDPEVTVTGQHLAAVQLLDSGGGLVAEFPVRALEGTETFSFVPRQVAPGRYRLRPVGPLYGSPASEQELTLLSPGFRVEPAEIHRLRGAELQVSADEGFDISRIRSLQLHVPDSGELVESLPVSSGRISIPPGRLGEGDYAVAIDGAPPSLELRVVGPAVTGITPNPVSQDASGGISLAIAGTHLDPLPLVLQEVDDPESVHALEGTGDGEYRSTAPPGRYVVAAAVEGMAPEPVSESVVAVLPMPVVTAVTPSSLQPGAETGVTVSGTNLAALDHLVLRPVDGSLQAVEVDVDRQRVLAGEGLESSFDFRVSLQPGTWQILPAAEVIRLDVFADCQDALDLYAESGDVDALLRCLEEGHPPDDVIRGAADLFYDRGRFDEARALYTKSVDLVGRFRAAFLGSFLYGEGVPLLVPQREEEGSAYGVAAARLGWSGARTAEFTEVALPWDLEYVRGLTSGDTESAVAAYRRSIDKKTAASGGHEEAAFAPAVHALASAQLERAVQLIGRVDVPTATGLLRDELIGNETAWGALGEDERSVALFWYGHLLLWYEGNEDAAAAVFRRALEVDGPGRAWSGEYAAALGVETPDLDEVGDSDWEATFVHLYRLFREATGNPNYNLLAASTETGSYLSGQEREKGAELRGLLDRLESLRPVDPFAHYALLHSVRNAQRVSWPAQGNSTIADEHRARLQALAVPPELEPLRQAYVVIGDLGPYDYSQVRTWTRAERSELADRIEVLDGVPLPQAIRDSMELLKQRFLDPSVVWWRQIRK